MQRGDRMTREEVANICKAMSDSNRLRIIEMLTQGEKCGCNLLEELQVTQPTLSHHMKILIECGLVESRKEGIWNIYMLNINKANRLILFLLDIVTKTEECEQCRHSSSYDCIEKNNDL